MKNSWQELIEITKLHRIKQFEFWLHDTLFSFSWWILLITSLVPLIIWLVVSDKKRLFEIITYGFLIICIAAVSDIIGAFLGLWQYKHTLTPLFSTIEIHFLQMPLIYMIIYQYFDKWKPFLIASTVNAFIFAFIFEPLLVWLQIYEVYKWKHIYSFFPYILIAIICKLIVDRIKRKYK